MTIKSSAGDHDGLAAHRRRVRVAANGEFSKAISVHISQHSH